MKALLFVLLFFGCHGKYPDEKVGLQAIYSSTAEIDKEIENKRLNWFGNEAKKWCASHHYNERFFFLADLALPSGKKRFFVYDMKGDSTICSSLVSHGCCNRSFLQTAHFSNEPGCGCSSYGKYKVGNKYVGKYGMAYKLTGLDSSNSNAWERNIVLHSYYSVPDTETYPEPIVNSYGCPMVSKSFLQILQTRINSSSKPILLWITD